MPTPPESRRSSLEGRENREQSHGSRPRAGITDHWMHACNLADQERDAPKGPRTTKETITEIILNSKYLTPREQRTKIPEYQNFLTQKDSAAISFNKSIKGQIETEINQMWADMTQRQRTIDNQLKSLHKRFTIAHEWVQAQFQARSDIPRSIKEDYEEMHQKALTEQESLEENIRKGESYDDLWNIKEKYYDQIASLEYKQSEVLEHIDPQWHKEVTSKVTESTTYIRSINSKLETAQEILNKQPENLTLEAKVDEVRHYINTDLGVSIEEAQILAYTTAPFDFTERAKHMSPLTQDTEKLKKVEIYLDNLLKQYNPR